MAGKLGKTSQLEISELAKLIAVQSEPIMAWTKNCNSVLLRGIAHGVCLAMGGAAKGLVELLEEDNDR